MDLLGKNNHGIAIQTAFFASHWSKETPPGNHRFPAAVKGLAVAPADEDQTKQDNQNAQNLCGKLQIGVERGFDRNLTRSKCNCQHPTGGEEQAGDNDTPDHVRPE